jgi:predicted transcriptional regulator of viral defense system
MQNRIGCRRKVYRVTHLSSIIQHMGDTIAVRPDHQCLLGAASAQHGYFTSVQAHACGFSRSLLSHTTNSGKFIRIRRGLYRLRDYPSFWREEVVAAWLALGKETAVVSHESALDLLELSDVIPHAIHLTVPRSKRNLPNLPGVRIHTTTRPFTALDLVTRDGIRLTSAGRTILDTAEWGTAPSKLRWPSSRRLQEGLSPQPNSPRKPAIGASGSRTS